MTFVCYRYNFDGAITAYGGGNDNNTNTVKAGPGTVYIEHGRTESNPQNKLLIEGDTVWYMQRQTRTQITGDATTDFDYDHIRITGEWHC